MENSDKKVKGVADIVFLMDATGSMGNCIQRLKDNVMVFFRSLTEKVAGANSVVPIKDWRAKVVGFRDYEADGAADWFVDNQFTRDVGELQRQLDALEAFGGGDAPESLLDAIYAVASMPKSGSAMEDPGMWRARNDAARAVIVFTDAPYKPTMRAPGCAGGTINDVTNICVQDRILLSVIAPRDLPGYECFEYIDAIRYAKWLPVRPGTTGDSPIDEFMNDTSALQEIIRTIAKTVTQHASEEL